MPARVDAEDVRDPRAEQLLMESAILLQEPRVAGADIEGDRQPAPASWSIPDLRVGACMLVGGAAAEIERDVARRVRRMEVAVPRLDYERLADLPRVGFAALSAESYLPFGGRR